MATIDAIRAMNPPGPRQVRSPFDRLLEIGAATPDLIVEVSSTLGNLGVPYLVCCGQIPTSLPVEDGDYQVPGERVGSIVNLSLRPLYVSVDGLGRCTVHQRPSSDSVAEAEATQVIGYLRLTDVEASYYRNYFDAITTSRPVERHINPDKTPEHVGRKRTPSTWEGEIVAYAREQFLRSMAMFVQHYRMLARRDIRIPKTLFGLFFLLLPGRVVTGDPPSPLAAAYVTDGISSRNRKVGRSRLVRAIKLRIPATDDFVPHLLSHASLFEKGEDELGWIGAVSLVEEYLSRFVEWPTPQHRPSINQSIKRQPLSTLPSDLLDRLRAIARLRNDLVHRSPSMVNQKLDFDAMLDAAFAAYSEINKRQLRARRQ